jgi:DNA helicase-2/ATP-dependent DNA helicase PcrA
MWCVEATRSANRLVSGTRDPCGVASPNPALARLLDRLDPEQRAAATAPPGPTLCIAPAGSGKTTTLVARLAWSLAGAPPQERARPGEVCAVTFNRRAAEELTERTRAVLGPLGLPPDAVRVRTFHALAREILVDAGVAVEPLVDRPALLRECFPNLSAEERGRLDDAIARLKIDHEISAADVAADPDPSPLGRAFLRYEAALADLGGLDFDDLVVRACRTLEARPALLDRWRRRCLDLLVDEVQDVDRAQLRLALLLAAPANRAFFVGDDDQTIYAWRLADVRRILDLDRSLPGLRRVDLVTNYRCPAVVVERAVRLVERNRERFRKTIRPRPGAEGRLVLAPFDGAADDEAAVAGAILDAWDAAGPTEGSRAILARTNRELLPAVAVAVERGLPFRIPRLGGPLLDPGLERLLAAVEAGDPGLPLLRRIAAAADGLGGEDAPPDRGPAAPNWDRDPPDDLDDPFERPAPDGAAGSSSALVQAVLGWAARFGPGDAAAFVAAVRERRDRLAALRRDDARLTLSTIHGVKGLEFDAVAVVGLTADGFPNARSVAAALEPERALEEERRLAYVAWTRARRSLTLVFDLARPSPFLLEAFDPSELGLALPGRDRVAPPPRAPPGRRTIER